MGAAVILYCTVKETKKKGGSKLAIEANMFFI